MPSSQDVKDLVREQVDKWILEIMGEHRWLSINGLLRHMAKKHPKTDEQEMEIKSVVWRLIIEEKLEFTCRRNLKKV